MKIPPKITPAHNASEMHATSFPVGRRGVRSYGLAMNRVVKDDGRDKKDHLDQERPVEIVHVGVGRKQQEPGKEHQHQTAERPEPGVLGELGGVWRRMPMPSSEKSTMAMVPIG